MTLALYNKWRPQKWDQVIGQDHVIQTLRNAITGDRVVHAYLFAGPRGTGKTTAARLLAKAVNCLHEDLASRPCNECAHCTAVNENRFLDLIEIDAASQNGVDEVRALRDKINFSPNQGRYKVYIIDEVHMFSNNAFNALLKTLEEPPSHAIFILATTEMSKIPATVLSRCQRYEFRRVPVKEIVSRLETIVKNEKLSAEPEALAMIARQSAGGMRDAISLLDQMSSTGKDISLEMTMTVLGTAPSESVLSLIDAIQEKDSSAGMNAIRTAMDAGIDPRMFARQVVDILRSLLMVKMGNGAQVDQTSETRKQLDDISRKFSTSEALFAIKTFNQAAVDQRGNWQPSLPLELALIDCIQAAVVKNSVAPPVTQNKPDKIQGSLTSAPAAVVPSQKAVRSETPVKPSGTFSKISQAWKQIRESMRSSHPQINGLLNSCQLVEIKDGVLVLGFNSEVVRSKMDVPENMEVTRKKIAAATGEDLPLRCVVTQARQAAPANIKAGGLVDAALKKGGELVDVQE